MTSRNKHRERSRKSRRQQAMMMDSVRRNSYTNMVMKMARSEHCEGRVKRLINALMSHIRRQRESKGNSNQGEE